MSTDNIAVHERIFSSLLINPVDFKERPQTHHKPQNSQYVSVGGNDGATTSD
jgi:hypothetical protein